MKFQKIGENRHGPINRVFLHSDIVGIVEKWHGLFVAKDWRGEGFGGFTFKTRKEAGEALCQRFTEWRDGGLNVHWSDEEVA